jgi:hypothetical protein
MTTFDKFIDNFNTYIEKAYSGVSEKLRLEYDAEDLQEYIDSQETPDHKAVSLRDFVYGLERVIDLVNKSPTLIFNDEESEIKYLKLKNDNLKKRYTAFKKSPVIDVINKLA